jgi:hypothetical protein
VRHRKAGETIRTFVVIVAILSVVLLVLRTTFVVSASFRRSR